MDRAHLYHLPGFYEPFSAISHLFGAVFFAWLGLLLLRRGRGDPLRLVFLGVYAVTCVLLFSMSGVYHEMIRGGAPHRVLERLDHGAIFLLIAGTFTPIQGILFSGWARWAPLILMWLATSACVTLKSIFFTDLPEWLGLGSYLTLSWIAATTAFVLWRRRGYRFIQPLLLGGIAYTVGGLADFRGNLAVIPGVVHAHELFHLAVLLGAFSQWLFIWGIARNELA